MKLLATDLMLDGALAKEDIDERCETGVFGRPSEEMAESELLERASGTLCSLKAPMVGSHVWVGLAVLHATVSPRYRTVHLIDTHRLANASLGSRRDLGFEGGSIEQCCGGLAKALVQILSRDEMSASAWRNGHNMCKC